MNLTLYCDASGKERDPILVVGGFVASVDSWLQFDDTWNVSLADFGIQYFHMKEFAHSTGQFKGWNSRNLGGPVVSVNEPVLGNPVNNPWPADGAPHVGGSEARGARRYREAKETKRRGGGRQEVGALHSTEEAGEPTRGTPWREGGAGTRERSRERWRSSARTLASAAFRIKI